MSALLDIDSSLLYGRSVSRELTATFVTQWKASHSDFRRRKHVATTRY
jgi:FMN-dependent NADH-azoreductase